MMMVVMIVAVFLAFFQSAARLFQGLFEILINPTHLLDRRPDITGQRPLPLINHRLLPFTVFAGMFSVMVYPVLQQYLYLISISHSRILQAGCS